jgi:RNA polymerase sigma-70 factor, ECF subfamily
MSAVASAITARPPFESVYAEFLPRITGFLRRKLSEPGDAEDVAAQVFVRAFQAYPRFELRGSTPAAWLFRIARNAAFDHCRRSRQRQWAEHAASQSGGQSDDPVSVAERRSQYRRLRYAIARLPQRQREVMAMRLNHGLSFAQVGAGIGCSEDAAKMIYHRSLRALRPLFTDRMAA